MAGLGAVLFQKDRPVAFASRALTETESRYANIEREMLAVVFGCERFHNFLFGQDFIVESNHKPLESIHLKHLSSAPARLRRMLLRLQPYAMVIKYKPGREVAVADALSRLPVEDTDAIPNLEAQIHDVQSQFSTEILSRIKSKQPKTLSSTCCAKSSTPVGQKREARHRHRVDPIGITATSYLLKMASSSKASAS